jgi:hypothetical protein
MITPSLKFIEQFKNTVGALSVTEAIALYNIALKAPEGIFIELGSHKGKCSQVIALAVGRLKEKATLILVEPEFSDDDWRNNVSWLVGKMIPYGGFYMYADYSINVLPENNEYSFVFVDSGSHADGLPMHEAILIDERIMSGGIVAWHDYLSQFVEVEIAYNYLLSTGKYEEVIINWDEVVSYAKEHDLEKGNNSWHHTELEFPCFLGALRRK